MIRLWREEEAQAYLLIFKNDILQGQKRYISTKRESVKTVIKFAGIIKLFLVKLKHKKNAYRGWKQR